MRLIDQSVSYVVMMKAYLASDHVSAATGKTIAITLSKAGSAFANPSAGATNATEVSSGWYKVTLSTTDTNTLGDLVVRGTEGTIDDVEQILQVHLGIANAVWDEPYADHVVDGTSFGGRMDDIAGGIDTMPGNVTDAVWDEAIAGHADAGSTGAVLSGAATQTLLVAIGDLVDTEVAAIKVVTDKLDTALVLDGAVYQFTTNALELAPSGGSAPTAADIADAVWDEVISGHLTAGTTGSDLHLTLTAANDTNSTVASINSKTINLPSDPADASDIAASFTALNTKVDTIDDFLDTEIAAIKAKTDNLPSDPADASDIAARFTTLDASVSNVDGDVATVLGLVSALPSAGSNADALLDRTDGIETSWTVRQGMRVMLGVLAGPTSGMATATAVLKNPANTKNRISATVDASGNRSAITYDKT